MEIDAAAGPIEAVEAQILAFALSEPAAEPPRPGRELDAFLGGRLKRLAASGDLPGEPGSASVVHVDGEIRAERIVVAGIGNPEQLDADALRTAASAVVRTGRSVGGTLAWALDPSLALPLAEQASAVADGVVLGNYDPGRWKTSGKRPKAFERLVLVGADDESLAAARATGRVAEWANRARDLANRPPNDLTPERLAERAVELAFQVEHVTVEVLGPAEIDALGMGALAAVASGSANPPRLIVLRYEPPVPRSEVQLGLVGKAITFDSGGISIKPAGGMEEMKNDMCGGAAVIEGIGALADLGVPLRVVGVVASAENMLGGGAFRPGDILTAANGKTIEITNTDAEGRLVLADALWYAREQGATHLAELSTLTGAMVLALGDLYAGVFGEPDEWRDLIVAAGEASGDHAWPWPLHRRYRRYVDSTFADLKNSSTLREGSPVLAAEFLREFAGNGPWAHLDIAGTAFISRARGDYLWQPGGTGYGVRLIVELARRLAG
jgi:leucyl aminopeptidase